MNNLEIICIQSFLLLAWFNTDVVVEYGSLFRLRKLLKIGDFESERINAFKMTYPIFLNLNYSNFIVKVLACPICLNTWLSILSYFIFGGSFGVTFIGSIILYYLIVKLKS